MIDFLLTLDKELFYLLNKTIANPVFDLMMPIVTDWNKFLISQIALLVLISYLLFFQGNKGKILVLLIAITLLISDQVSSSLIKPLVARARPCHIIDGKYVVENLRLLVSCGPGYSFPSSHAVNNFALAVLFSLNYKKMKILFIAFAILVAFSRIYVGVHYPSDVFLGALIGILIALILYNLSNVLIKAFQKKS